MENTLRDELLKVFPGRLRGILGEVPWYKENLEEIRVRIKQPLLFVYGDQFLYLHRYGQTMTKIAKEGVLITPEDMQEMMLYLCEYSKYAYQKQLAQGFLALRGGIRVGVAGMEMEGLEYPGFFNIRVPSERRGCGDGILPYLIENRKLCHTLILAPPGVGKTTLLRDLVRGISEQEWCKSIAVIDERYEIGACHLGVPMNDVGAFTDVYSGYNKAKGCKLALRTMAPQVIAVDEIGGKEDGEVLSYGMNCGTSILATMHGGNMEEYYSLQSQCKEYENLKFQRFILLHRNSKGGIEKTLFDEGGERLC